LSCIFDEKLIVENGRVATTPFTEPIRVLFDLNEVLKESKNKKEVEFDLFLITAHLLELQLVFSGSWYKSKYSTKKPSKRGLFCGVFAFSRPNSYLFCVDLSLVYPVTMRKEEFSRLSISQKIKTLYLEGSFVVAIRYYRHKVNLYLLGDEYVEVFYNHKLDQIEKIEFLARKHSRMKFYLDQIKL